MTVEFNFVQAWRYDDGGDILDISTGDGGFIDATSPGSGFGDVEFTPVNNFFDDNGTPGDTSDDIGYTGTDLAGFPYTVRSYVAQYTYSALSIQNSNGVFLAYGESCCRIGGLENAGGSEKVQTIVDLNNGNLGSPVSTIPVILQMSVAKNNSLGIAVADPDGDPFTCRMSTFDESFIDSVANQGGQELAVSSNCVLNWDLSSTTLADVGKRYAVQVMIEESNHCSVFVPPSNNQDPQALVAQTCGGVALDFIIELVEGNPPTCTADQPINSLAFANQPFTVNFTGTDLDPDTTLTMTALGLPAGATVNPASASSGPAPFVTTVNWTPSNADKNSAHAVLITYRDERGLQGTCSLSIEVPPNTPPACNAGGPYAIACTGISAAGALSGLSTTDVDSDPFSYAWTVTDPACAGASFSDPSSATPVVNLPGEAGSTSSKTCQVTLTTSDGEFASTCTAAVTVLP